MKTIHWIIAFLLAAMVFVGGYFVGEKVSHYRVPSGKELVSRAFLDSLYNLKPDTVIIDSIIIATDTITIEKPYLIPVPIEGKENIVFYSDTTRREDLFLVINDTVEGRILHRSIQYTPHTVLTEIHTPYPVIVEREVFLSRPDRYHLYLGGQTIFNPVMYGGGLEVGLRTPKHIQFTGGAVTDGHNVYVTFRTGVHFELDIRKLIGL